VATKNMASSTTLIKIGVFIYKAYPMKNKKAVTKNEFVRLRIDSIEKSRLDRLCSITRRQKSDIVREGLFELYKLKYPECLVD
jgi:hypothetical protein